MTATTHHSPYALELKDLRKSFGKTEIIRGVNLAVRHGERVAVIGPNGAGKSTLFNLISGRFGASSGDVLLNGTSIMGKKPYEINRLGLSRSFQITNIFPKLSVFENLRCSVLWSLGYKYTFFKFLSGLHDANARATELMQMINLDKKRDVLAMNLTYAEQRALEIGITIGGGANGNVDNPQYEWLEGELDRNSSTSYNAKGKLVKRYKHEDVKTPLERLLLLDAEGLVTFKPGITRDTLKIQAKSQTDLAAAQAMQRAKRELFAGFVKPKRRA